MRELIARLKARGELREVTRTVDPTFELAAVTRAAQAQGADAILFRDVTGTALPVITNLYGSRRRMCELIGAADGNYCQRWAEIQKGARDAGFPPVSDVEPEADLIAGRVTDLPLITYFERDAGPYFTAGIFLARDPETGVPNLSFHRAMHVSDDEMRIRLGDTHDLKRYFDKAEAAGEPLEAAMLIGPSPELFIAAAASLPIEDDELRRASAIAGRPIPMRPGRAIGLKVPAGAEIVVEGRLVPGVRRPEGPFGEFMGMYVPVGDNVVFEVLDVSWRDGAAFHSLNCGSPEDMWPLELAIAARIYGHISPELPGIVDVSCHPTLMNTVVKIKKLYEGHPRHVALAAIGAHLDYSKACFVVDEDIDIYDFDQVIWAYLTRGRADTRAYILNDVPGFYRDPHRDHWGRLVIDATMPLGREAEFERKRIPGADDIDLADYLDG